MAVEVEVWDPATHQKWMKIWQRLGERILKMPKWMQDIVLEDINAAVKNRIATMEMIIQHAKAKH